MQEHCAYFHDVEEFHFMFKWLCGVITIHVEKNGSGEEISAAVNDVIIMTSLNTVSRHTYQSYTHDIMYSIQNVYLHNQSQT